MLAMISLLALAASLPIPLVSALPHAHISVNAHTRFQQVDGFGFSEAFQRARDIYGKDGLSPENRTRVLDLLFSDTRGAGLTIVRNGIGSSNSSIKDFMNSIEPFSPGSPSALPHYVWDRNDSGQVWLSHEAASYGVNTFYADAWSAPGYMKTNDDDSNGGYLCGVSNTSCASGDWKQAYANYLVQYIRFYQQVGIKVTHLGFLNEPQEDVTYASMLSDGTQAADFIKVLAPTVKAAGLDVKLTCCDGVGWEEQRAMLPGLQAGGPEHSAESYLSVITAHGYNSPPTTPLETSLPVWMTEWADLNDNCTAAWYENGAPGEGLTWANRIQDAFTRSNVSAFLHWIGAENGTSNSPLINLNGDSYVVSKRLWAFGQFSRFVRPGAVRIDAASSDPLVTVSAFQNKENGVVATQVINNADTDYEVEVDLTGHGGLVSVVQPYLTNNEHDLEASSPIITLALGAATKFTSIVPARSLVSFVSK